MAKQIVKCNCGCSWEHTAPGPIPADPSKVCPNCSLQDTLDQPSSTDRREDPEEDVLPRFQTGHVFAGFEILEELNRGGMGVVYKARQHGLNRIVALKVISPERLGQTETVHRFAREGQAAARLNHPNIVTVYHTDLAAEKPYLAMEFVSGIDLARLVKLVGPLPIEDACLYIQQTAQGLQHAFEQDLVHRDIKPANLMVTPSPLDKTSTGGIRAPRVKILDMGLARINSRSEDDFSFDLTKAGEFLGTPDFISPEQAEDPRSVDIRSDLYSLGASFYYLLTGSIPFPGKNLVQKVRKQMTQPPPSPKMKREEVPAKLDRLVCRLMAQDPKERFQTPQELIEAINDFLRSPETEEQDAQAEPATPTAPAVKPSVDQQIHAHDGGVFALAVSQDGKKILTGGLDETIRVWCTETWRELLCLEDDVGPVLSLSMSASGNWAASSSLRLFQEDMVVQLWDLRTGQQRRRMKGHRKEVRSVALATDARKVASASADQTIRIWTLDKEGTPSRVLRGHTDQVSSVFFISNGSTLLSGSLDGTIKLWDSGTGNLKGDLNPKVGPITALAFSAATQRMAIAGNALTIRQRNGSFILTRGRRISVLCVDFSPDGTLVLTGGGDG
ncbi:MAG: protein kinase, partial [Bdellovibrionales bacterium]